MQRKRLIYWLAQSLGWTFYLILSGFSNYLNNELNRQILIALAAIFVSGFLLSHLYRTFIIRMKWLSLNLLAALVPIVLSASVLAFILGTLQLTYTHFLIPGSGAFTQLAASNAFLIWLNWWVIFVIWSILYFAYHFFEKSRDEEIKNLRLEARSTEVELNNLKAQLNPHFMFNSMNSIRALIDENPDLAKESVTKLSNILRNTLLMGRRKLVMLEEELDIVYDYLHLEHIRYEERLQVKFDIEEDTLKCLVPPLMLQTLVENAIKHGISRLPGGGFVCIRISKKGHYLYLLVRNTGTLEPEYSRTGTGTGLDNTRQRLELLFEGRATFKMYAENSEVRVEIVLPVVNLSYESHSN